MYVCQLVSDGGGQERGFLGYGTNTGGFDLCFSFAEQNQQKEGMI